MKEAGQEAKSGFIVKASESGASIELLETFELTPEFTQLVCVPYFKHVFKDLSNRSALPERGIQRLPFLEYVGIPGFIADKLFNLFDVDEDGYLDLSEFSLGMLKFYTNDLKTKLKLIFDIYDFNKDGKISRGDVSLLLSHVPLDSLAKESLGAKEGKFTQNGGGADKYSDREESQCELSNLLKVCFVEHSELNFEEFTNICEKVSSEMFLCVFSLIKPHLPSVSQFKKYERGLKGKTDSPLLTPKSGSKLAQPKLLSRFSPLSQIVKSYTPKVEGKASAAENFGEMVEEEEKTKARIVSIKKAVPKRVSQFGKHKVIAVDSPIGPVVRLSKGNVNFGDVAAIASLPIEEKTLMFCECGKEIVDFERLLCAGCAKTNNLNKLEGELLKQRAAGNKTYWISIERKELYYYESRESKVHKCMHSLVGCFIREEATEKVAGTVMYPFSLIFPKKTTKLYSRTKEDYNRWVDGIKSIIGYANLLDFYDLKEELGKGKFGVVRAGIHKKTGQRAAVKVMKKAAMTQQDIELVKREIEILKLCQHPNLIRMLDVFENSNYIYIVMEFLKGGDLFSYLEKKQFKIPERKAAKIILSIANALQYLHSYGIIHRDIKPENILLTEEKDEFDVEIVDFGLSKIVGPEEFCTEPFGTLSYVSPEILLQKPYGKKVDVWSLGIIGHLLLVGSTPFDHEDEREVARLTISAEVDYSTKEWKKLSKLSIDFIKKMLVKNPEKRLSLDEVLKHPWLKSEARETKDGRSYSVPECPWASPDLLKQILKKKQHE